MRPLTSRPRPLLAILLLALLTPAQTHPPAAQAPPAAPAVPLLGIVEVPRLFGAIQMDGMVAPPDGTSPPVLLRARPAADAPVLAAVRASGEIDAAEHDYEEAGALVFGREQQWTLLRTRDGTLGWMAPGDGGAFHALEDLLSRGLTYLTEDWDGTLSAAPGAPGGAVSPDPRRHIAGSLQPQTERTRVVLRPGEDPDAVRERYRASASRLRTETDGTRTLDLEVGTAHPLFERPDVHAPVLGEVETNRAGDVLATTMSVPARVPVFERREGWFEVALRSERWQEARRAWLEASHAWVFHPLTEGEAAPFMARVWPDPPRSVRVAGFRRLDGRLWAEVEVLSDSPCEVAGEPAVVAQGWVAVHAASGDPAVWFWSRGC